MAALLQLSILVHTKKKNDHLHQTPNYEVILEAELEGLKAFIISLTIFYHILYILIGRGIIYEDHFLLYGPLKCKAVFVLKMFR